MDPKAKTENPELPYWYDQLGSFNKEHIINELDGILEPYILSAALESIDLQQLFERNAVKNIDVLHIDTEGYDWKILSQLDLSIHAPKFILFEYNHLSKEELEASFSFLGKKYKLFNIGIDMLAVNKEFGEKNIRLMEKHMKKATLNQMKSE